MDTKLSKFVFSQLGKRRNLWNLRFNELYLLSANPSGISHINIYSFKKSCIHALAKEPTQLWTLKVFTLCLK